MSPDGICHEHTQNHPELLRFLASAPAGGFTIDIEPLPQPSKSTLKFQVSSS